MAFGIEDLEADPVDQQRVLAVAQRNAFDPAVTARFGRLALAVPVFMALEFGVRHEVTKRFVRAFLVGGYEIIAAILHDFGDGLAGGRRRDKQAATGEVFRHASPTSV